MDTISQIKHKLDIVDIVGGYVALTKSGKNYKGLCPFHNEKTPSFIVSPDIQIFKCFGCSESGDIFAFIQKVEGLDFHAAKKKLAEKAGVDISGEEPHDAEQSIKNKLFGINNLSAKIYNRVLTTHAAGKKGLDYFLNKRKLTQELIKDFQLGYAPDGWDTTLKLLLQKGYTYKDLDAAGIAIEKSNKNGYIDKFRDRVIFPLTGIDGNVVGFIGRTLADEVKPKYLNTAETLIFKKSNFLYGFHRAKIHIRKEGAIIVEGPMDVISCAKLNINNVIAPLGTALTYAHLDTLSKHTKDITFCFDGDLAGIQASYRAIQLADSMGFNIKCIIIPKEYKDLDELITKNPDLALTTITNNVLFYDYVLYTLIRANDINSPYGKRKTLEQAVPYFKGISSSVVIEHYKKLIHEQLDVPLSVVSAALSSDKASFAVMDDLVDKEPAVVEKLFLALLLQSDIDIARDFVYKVSSEDFADPALGPLFSEVSDFLKRNSEKSTIKDVGSKLDPAQTKLFDDLLLWDTKLDLQTDDSVVKELDKALRRILSASSKRQLLQLSKEIKAAEAKKDFETIMKLSARMHELSKNLL